MARKRKGPTPRRAARGRPPALLYHFTLDRYVESIREHGLISLARKQAAGMMPPGWQPPPKQFPRENDLVWLTRDPDSNAGLQYPDTVVVRVTVEAPSAVLWLPNAADSYRCPKRWRDIMRRAALELSPANRDRDWYVVEHRVPPERIAAIEVLP